MKFRSCIITVAVLMAIGSPAAASDCDILVEHLLSGVPELKLTGTKRMAGAPDFDLALLKHPQASAIALNCGAQLPSVNVDWRGSPPPPGYFELVGLLGGIVTGVAPGVVRAGALECDKRAREAAYEMSGYHLAGVKFECAIYTHEGGGVSMTVHG